MLAPERVTKLVNVAGVTSAHLMPAVERLNYKFIALAKALPMLYSLWHWLFRYDWVIRSAFATWFHQIDTVPLDQWAEDRAMAFRPDIHIAAYESGQAIHNLDLRPYLAKITAPTLTIFGQQDAIVPISDGYLVQERVPNSHLVLIHACGHFPMYEQTQQYLVILQDFLMD
jgi:pimeloyl-ACP methyl ester carboxylesterase